MTLQIVLESLRQSPKRLHSVAKRLFMCQAPVHTVYYNLETIEHLIIYLSSINGITE